MPLYDIRCSHCEGIFERLIPLQALHGQTCCPYCKQETAASPMPTGGHVGLQVKHRAGRATVPSSWPAGGDRAGDACRRRPQQRAAQLQGHSCSICAT
jgi:putative FmdB family regulatory protein